jgi:hypothetical protein
LASFGDAERPAVRSHAERGNERRLKSHIEEIAPMEGLAGFFFLGWIFSIMLRHYVWGEPWFRWK